MKIRCTLRLCFCLMLLSAACASALDAPFTGFASIARSNGHARLAWHLTDAPVSIVLTPSNGAAVSDIAYCLTFNGDVCAVWAQGDADDTDVFAQLYSPAGPPRWSAHAAEVFRFRGHQRAPRVVPAVDGGVFIVWESDSAGTNNVNLWCQRLLPNGRVVWDIPVPICTHEGNQRNVALAPDPEGGIIVTWEDYRDGNADIYGQRIEYDGSPLDQEDGVAIEVAPGRQSDVRFVYNELGRPVSLQWFDHRPDFDEPVRVETDLARLPIPEPALTPLLALAGLLACRRWAAR